MKHKLPKGISRRTFFSRNRRRISSSNDYSGKRVGPGRKSGAFGSGSTWSGRLGMQGPGRYQMLFLRLEGLPGGRGVRSR